MPISRPRGARRRSRARLTGGRPRHAAAPADRRSPGPVGGTTAADQLRPGCRGVGRRSRGALVSSGGAAPTDRRSQGCPGECSPAQPGVRGGGAEARVPEGGGARGCRGAGQRSPGCRGVHPHGGPGVAECVLGGTSSRDTTRGSRQGRSACTGTRNSTDRQSATCVPGTGSSETTVPEPGGPISGRERPIGKPRTGTGRSGAADRCGVVPEPAEHVRACHQPAALEPAAPGQAG